MNTLQKIAGQNATGTFSVPAAKPQTSGSAFAGILAKKVDALTFSDHAQTRVKSRNIDMSQDRMDKLTNAVDAAQKKGSKNSLILFPDSAFIVNIPNRTVVTAMDGENIRENIFTNIDSTVLAG